MDRTLVNGKAQATANEKWYQKARDWMKKKCTNLLEKCDSVGLTMMKAAVVVSVPIMIATGAGCGGKTGLIDDPIYPERDAEADVETDGDADSDVDADGDVDGDVDSDVDGDVDSDSDSDTDTDADGDSDGDADFEGDADLDEEPDGDVAPPLVPIFGSLIGDHQ